MTKTAERPVSFASHIHRGEHRWAAKFGASVLRPWYRLSAFLTRYYRRRLWVREILSLTLSAVVILVMCIVLRLNSGQPISKTSTGGPFTLNAFVSLFITILYLLLMVPITSCLSQLKWLHFKSMRCLRDFERYDAASRGLVTPDAFGILVRPKYGLLGSLAVSLGLAMLAVGPLSQQILQVESALLALDLPAIVPVTASYIPSSIHFFGGVTTAIAAGVFSKSAIDLRVAASCGGTKCIWDQYSTFGFESSCGDVTDRIAYADSSALTRVMKEPAASLGKDAGDLLQTDVMRVPGGVGITAADLRQQSLQPGSFTILWENKKEPTAARNVSFSFEFLRLWPLERRSGVSPAVVQILYSPVNVTARHPHGDADLTTNNWDIASDRQLQPLNITRVWECTISPALQTFTSSFSKESLSEVQVATNTTSEFGYYREENTKPYDSMFLSFTDPQNQLHVLPAGLVSHTFYSFDLLFNETTSVQDDLGSSNRSAMMDRIYNLVTLDPFRLHASSGTDHGTVDGLMRNVALGMTQFFRENYGGVAEGTSWSEQIVYDIQWAWLAIPVVLIIGTAILVFLTARKSRLMGVPVWSESSIATMAHGIDDIVKYDLRELQEFEDLGKTSEGIYVRLAGPRLCLET